MLPDETADEVLFFGGEDYIPLFCQLSAGIKSKQTVFYNSRHPPDAPGACWRNSRQRQGLTGITSVRTGP